MAELKPYLDNTAFGALGELTTIKHLQTLYKIQDEENTVVQIEHYRDRLSEEHIKNSEGRGIAVANKFFDEFSSKNHLATKIVHVAKKSTFEKHIGRKVNQKSDPSDILVYFDGVGWHGISYKNSKTNTVGSYGLKEIDCIFATNLAAISSEFTKTIDLIYGSKDRNERQVLKAAEQAINSASSITCRIAAEKFSQAFASSSLATKKESLLNWLKLSPTIDYVLCKGAGYSGNYTASIIHHKDIPAVSMIHNATTIDAIKNMSTEVKFLIDKKIVVGAGDFRFTHKGFTSLSMTVSLKNKV